MKTLAMIKMEKNFVAVIEKGYPRYPYKHFTIGFMQNRLAEEKAELDDAIKEGNIDHILSELADISNIVDYIAEMLT